MNLQYTQTKLTNSTALVDTYEKIFKGGQSFVVTDIQYENFHG